VWELSYTRVGLNHIMKGWSCEPSIPHYNCTVANGFLPVEPDYGLE